MKPRGWWYCFPQPVATEQITRSSVKLCLPTDFVLSALRLSRSHLVFLVKKIGVFFTF